MDMRGKTSEAGLVSHEAMNVDEKQSSLTCAIHGGVWHKRLR
jgi:hypothetical protein